MQPAIRKEYNTAFTQLKYQQLVADMSEGIAGGIDFRLAETPVFIDAALRDQMLEAGKEICNYINGPHFKERTQHAFKQVATPPNENPLPDCIVMDYAICSNERVNYFPSLLNYRDSHPFLVLKRDITKLFKIILHCQKDIVLI